MVKNLIFELAKAFRYSYQCHWLNTVVAPSLQGREGVSFLTLPTKGVQIFLMKREG